jgi:hypothetical protein
MRTAVALIAVVAVWLPLSSAVQAGAAGTTSCSFTAPPPVKDGNDVKATASVGGCGTYTWNLVVQRHSYGPFWQNLATNYQPGDGTFSVSAGCRGNGTRTYRSILESTAGHKTVSGHARFHC